MDCVTSCAHADKLDGLKVSGKRKREDVAGLDDYLQLPDDYATRTSQPGKKRVNAPAASTQRDSRKAASTDASFRKVEATFPSLQDNIQGGFTPQPPMLTLGPVRCSALRFAGPTWRSRRKPIGSALSDLWSAKRTGSE